MKNSFFKSLLIALLLLLPASALADDLKPVVTEMKVCVVDKKAADSKCDDGDDIRPLRGVWDG